MCVFGICVYMCYFLLTPFLTFHRHLRHSKNSAYSDDAGTTVLIGHTKLLLYPN